jgi:putative Mg2+ transporter-C (MgtC) family protein
MIDFGVDWAYAVRLIAAAGLGALIGLEREIHDHPAGMRTHLLVSLGSAGFTVLSIAAFAAPGADPARIAAQIVTGIGFLGAGAILKEGATIRGLTTAASLWAVAAVGMAAGAGAWGVAVTATVIVILSLGPLRLLSERFVGRNVHRLRLRVGVTDPARIAALVDLVTSQGGTIAALSTSEPANGGMAADIEVKLPDVDAGVRLTSQVAGMDGVRLLESKAVGD